MTTTTKSKPSSRHRETSAPDPATDYARAVVAGDIVAGKLVKLACQRHLDDLETAAERGFHWRPEVAKQIYDVANILRHWKGRWAGKPIKLEPWEYFFLGSIWGWRRSDGTRRFRHVHLEVARKNGKTLLAAILALALLLFDNESGAAIYCVATKLDQSRITHEDCKQLAKASPQILRRLDIFRSSITSGNNSLQPLGRDSGTMDGLNIHGAIVDELHAWRDRLLWDVVTTATGARDQPLIVRTTTAGYDKQTLWWELRQQAVGALTGKRNDDRLFALIYTIDDDDDWKDPACYIKANPSLDVTVKLEDLIAERDDAIATPAQQPSFRRLKLNQLTEALSTWLDIDRWDACAGAPSEDELAGMDCLTGIDLSTSQDLTAAVHFFPGTDTRPAILIPRLWLPEEGIDVKADRDGQPYRQWAEQGWLNLIPGPMIRYEAIEEQLKRDAEKFSIRHLIYDRYLARQTAARMQDMGFNCCEYGQGYQSMHPAVVEFEKLVASGRVRHNGSPLLRSCVANVAIDHDPAGNRKPNKKKSTGRIDGAVAALMAVGGMLALNFGGGAGGFESW